MTPSTMGQTTNITNIVAETRLTGRPGNRLPVVGTAIMTIASGMTIPVPRNGQAARHRSRYDGFPDVRVDGLLSSLWGAWLIFPNRRPGRARLHGYSRVRWVRNPLPIIVSPLPRACDRFGPGRSYLVSVREFAEQSSEPPRSSQLILQLDQARDATSLGRVG